MLELLLCSLVTLLPDYLYRRYGQGKRIGHEITLYSFWYELRYGLTSCLMLAIALITAVFYFHPATNSAALYYRTVPILPEGSGRVAEVNVGVSAPVRQGQVIFRLDDARQKAALDAAQRKVAEVDAALIASEADVQKADAQIQEARGAWQQAKDELDVKLDLQRRNPNIVAQRDIEKLQVALDQRQAGIDAAIAVRRSALLRVSTLLPAEKESALAARAQAQVELDKTIIRAGIDGRVEQFVLRTGDVVNPLMRPAGVLIPEDAGQVLQAGFGQIEAQVLKPGMVAEAVCLSKPWVVIPMVITTVQDFIAAGQFRGGDQLMEAQNGVRPGTILVFLEPLYKNGLDGVTAGSSCTVNAYSSNHDEIAAPTTGTARRIGLHAIDAIGFVHALLLRIQAAIMPVRVLVTGGH